MREIKSITIGPSEKGLFFTTEEKNIGYSSFVHEIKEEVKTIGMGYYNDLTLTVYRGYELPGPILKFEIEANSSLVIQYK